MVPLVPYNIFNHGTLFFQNKGEELLARAIYASTCPLNMFDNIHWRNAFQHLRPSFQPPRRFALSNALLEAEYVRVSSIVNQKVESASTLGMQLDSWTNIRNEAVVNVVVTTPQPVFYKSVATGAESHSAINMCKVVETTLVEIGLDKCIGLVSDNAKNMTAMWDILKEKDAYKHIHCYGCAAHCLNLLAGDIMKLETAHNILQSAKSIVNTVNRSHLIIAQFRVYHNRALSLPVVTRWNSSLTCLKSLSNAQNSLQRLVVDTKTREIIPAAVKKIILDDEIFWVRVQKLVGILEPIAKWTTILEGDTALLGDVTAAFKEISNKTENLLRDSPFTKSEEVKVMGFVEHRATFCLRPIHWAANFLNPKYKGINLTTREEIDAMETISKMATHMHLVESTVLAELAEFKLGEGDLFSRQFVWNAAEKCTPWQWWAGICGSTSLGKIGKAILQLPATSAATERTFSTCGATHTIKRNRLLAGRALKLSYVKHNLKITEDGGTRTHVPRLKERSANVPGTEMIPGTEITNANLNELEDEDIADHSFDTTSNASYEIESNAVDFDYGDDAHEDESVPFLGFTS